MAQYDPMMLPRMPKILLLIRKKEKIVMIMIINVDPLAHPNPESI
jgi:hypothetical protein